VVTGLQWSGPTPAFGPRVVIAAPHPDDEVLGCAGIMAWLVDRGIRVEIVAVTDGDASHARSTRITRPVLVARRRCERDRALAALGLPSLPVDRLQLPDGRVHAHERVLDGALRSRLDRSTTLVVPWHADGHPDHEAVGRAGRRAAAAVGASCVEVPIWARVRGRACRPSHVLELGAFRACKRAAVEEFASQVVALGPDALDGPVVHPDELAAMTSPTEWLVQAP
jgi:LmbE family N-acetylglucosaminyl deacetylase